MHGRVRAWIAGRTCLVLMRDWFVRVCVRGRGEGVSRTLWRLRCDGQICAYWCENQDKSSYPPKPKDKQKGNARQDLLFNMKDA